MAPDVDQTPAACPSSSALAVLGTLADAVMVADGEGRILYVNPSAAALLHWPADELTGQALEVAMPARMRGAHANGFARFWRTRVARVIGQPVRVPALRRDGQEIDIELNLSLFAEAGRAPVVIALLRDLRVRTELEVQLNAQKRLLAQYALMSALANSGSLGEAAPKVLQALCTSLSWDAGIFWWIESDSERLAVLAHWAQPASPAAAFAQGSRAFTFAPGTGLPGYVWQHAKASWRANLQGDEDYLRKALAREHGLNEAVAFPLAYKGRVLGVMEFVNQAVAPPDEELLQTIATASLQIGLFCERLRAEAALRESREWLNTTLRSIGDAVVVTDRDSNVVMLNPAAEKLTGVRECEAAGRFIDQVIGARNDAGYGPGELVQALFRQEKAQVQTEETFLPAEPCRPLVLEQSVAPVWADDDSVRGAVLVYRNVSERTIIQENANFLSQAAAALSSARDISDALTTVLEMAVPGYADWAVIYRGEEGERAWSAAAVVCHNPAGQAAARDFADQLLGHPDHCASPQACVRAEGATLHVGTTAPRWTIPAAGSQVAPAAAITAPIRARSRTFGALCLFFCAGSRSPTANDLELGARLASHLGYTLDNARLYQAARRAVEARDSFLSVASHELKTPLTSLQLQLQLLHRSAVRLALPEPALARVDKMRNQIARLHGLIVRLLEVSQVGSSPMVIRPSATDLARVVRDVVGRLRADPQMGGNEIALDLPGRLLGAWDGLRIEQVMLNLLGNAVKFGAGKPVAVSLRVHGGAAQISIADHGLGIALQDQERIFQRYERAVSARHYSGFGLGLSMSRQLVEAMGGSITLHSSLGEGSTFVVTLPYQGPTGHQRLL